MQAELEPALCLTTKPRLLKLILMRNWCVRIWSRTRVQQQLCSFWRSAGHSPWGSTSLASLSASELARSVLAGVTARIRQLSRQMNCMIMSRIWCSMSAGWSPTGTLVMPGRSMRVRFSTAQRPEHRQENEDHKRRVNQLQGEARSSLMTVWSIHYTHIINPSV